MLLPVLTSIITESVTLVIVVQSTGGIMYNGKKLDTKRYLKYLEVHPEIMESQPPIPYTRIEWQRKLMLCRLSYEAANKEMMSIVRHWENYHVNQARALGYDIDMEEFNWEKGTPFTRLTKLQHMNN